ncbi:hypothetical protein [Dyadobacter sandarakinus]|uniref:C1q domain-containing protein n=1 Tax=Dyadobacter sandarakinus TaxID=2747268 RepID=A0ABX7I0A2_9BACT|nr:hypothetical protein [Dyadobacter sandarakinus]QRQ99431.1 hypothetical protein HWI92_00140 [Dyadobacter sandarakinus]
MKSNIHICLPAKYVRTLLGYTTFLALTVLSFTALAQVGVGTTTPDASAQLDVTASNKGILIPRLTESGRSSIAAPANGLLIYQTDNTPGFYYFNGSQWLPIAGAGSNAPAIGFSAVGTTSSQSTAGAINASWFIRYINQGSLDVSTSTYTVPQNGLYKVSAKLNYVQPTASTVSLGAGVDPNIQVRVNGSEVGRSLFPIYNVNIALVLTLRTMVNTGTLVFDDVLSLNQNDQLGLYYDNDGYTAAIELGSSSNGITWTVMRIGDSPVSPP